MSLVDIPDIHELLAADGSLHLDAPQTEADVLAAVEKAIDVAKDAYRIAYNHAAGDTEADTVDGLDLAINALISIASDIA